MLRTFLYCCSFSCPLFRDRGVPAGYAPSPCGRGSAREACTHWRRVEVEETVCPCARSVDGRNTDTPLLVSVFLSRMAHVIAILLLGFSYVYLASELELLSQLQLHSVYWESWAMGDSVPISEWLETKGGKSMRPV